MPLISGSFLRSWSPFGSSYSLQPLLVWGHKLCIPGFEDVLLLSYFVSVQTFSAPSRHVWLGSSQSSGCSSQDVHRFVPNTLLHCLGCLPRISDCWKVNFSSVWGPECTRLVFQSGCWGLHLATTPWSSDGAVDLLEQSPLLLELSHTDHQVPVKVRDNSAQSFGEDRDDNTSLGTWLLSRVLLMYLVLRRSLRVLCDNLEISRTGHFCHSSGIWQPFFLFYYFY